MRTLIKSALQGALALKQIAGAPPSPPIPAPCVRAHTCTHRSTPSQDLEGADDAIL